jgi:DNA repair protein RadD
MIQVGPFILDDYQERSVPALRAEFSAGKKRVILVAPTGAGKTIVSLAIEKMCIEAGTRVAFITSGRQLIFQKAKAAKEAGLDFSVLMGDSPFEWNPDAALTIVSKDTLTARHGKSLSWREPGMFIVDECDVSLSSIWRKILDRAPRTLGLTGTPITGSGGPLPFYEAFVEVAPYSVLIKSGRLVDVPLGNLFSPYRPSLKGGETSNGDWNTRWLGGRMNRPKLVGDIVEHWKKYGEGRPTICFCVNKAHTAAVCDAFNGAGVQAEFIVDETPQAERREIFEATEVGFNKVICNCATLTRGFDLPMLSCCILARPTKSLRLILQMIGRVLRSSPGKVDAMVFDHSGAVLEVLGWPTEDRVWSIDPDADLEELQDEERKKNGTEELARLCSACKCLMPRSSQVCPNPDCGYVKTQSAHMAETEDGRLVRVTKKRKTKGPPTEADQLKKQWAGILIPFGKLGYKWINAAKVFHDRTGQWPEAAKMPWTVESNDYQTRIDKLFPWVNPKNRRK